MSKTIKTSTIVFLIGFIPLGIFGIANWEPNEMLGQLVYTFTLMIGFMGVPIYFMTLLYELIIVKKSGGMMKKKAIFQFTVIVNTIVLLGGLYACVQYFNPNPWNSVSKILSMYLEEYALFNLVVTIATFMIPTVYSRLSRTNLP